MSYVHITIDLNINDAERTPAPTANVQTAKAAVRWRPRSLVLKDRLTQLCCQHRLVSHEDRDIGGVVVDLSSHCSLEQTSKTVLALGVLGELGILAEQGRQNLNITVVILRRALKEVTYPHEPRMFLDPPWLKLVSRSLGVDEMGVRRIANPENTDSLADENVSDVLNSVKVSSKPLRDVRPPHQLVFDVFVFSKPRDSSESHSSFADFQLGLTDTSSTIGNRVESAPEIERLTSASLAYTDMGLSIVSGYLVYHASKMVPVLGYHSLLGLSHRDALRYLDNHIAPRILERHKWVMPFINKVENVSSNDLELDCSSIPIILVPGWSKAIALRSCILCPEGDCTLQDILAHAHVNKVVQQIGFAGGVNTSAMRVRPMRDTELQHRLKCGMDIWGKTIDEVSPSSILLNPGILHKSPRQNPYWHARWIDVVLDQSSSSICSCRINSIFGRCSLLMSNQVDPVSSMQLTAPTLHRSASTSLVASSPNCCVRYVNAHLSYNTTVTECGYPKIEVRVKFKGTLQILMFERGGTISQFNLVCGQGRDVGNKTESIPRESESDISSHPSDVDLKQANAIDGEEYRDVKRKRLSEKGSMNPGASSTTPKGSLVRPRGRPRRGSKDEERSGLVRDIRTDSNMDEDCEETRGRLISSVPVPPSKGGRKRGAQESIRDMWADCRNSWDGLPIAYALINAEHTRYFWGDTQPKVRFILVDPHHDNGVYPGLDFRQPEWPCWLELIDEFRFPTQGSVGISPAWRIQAIHVLREKAMNGRKCVAICALLMNIARNDPCDIVRQLAASSLPMDHIIQFDPLEFFPDFVNNQSLPGILSRLEELAFECINTNDEGGILNVIKYVELLIRVCDSDLAPQLSCSECNLRALVGLCEALVHEYIDPYLSHEHTNELRDKFVSTRWSAFKPSRDLVFVTAIPDSYWFVRDWFYKTYSMLHASRHRL